jgi:predicted PurR-regulated permease PerM
MIVVTRNWKLSLVGLAVSVGIFLVLFFTVIQPSTNTANAAIKSGLHQTQQAIKQAQKQVNNSASAADGQSAATSKKIKAVTKQANQQLSQAGKLATCVSAAGTDPTKLANCQTKFN